MKTPDEIKKWLTGFANDLDDLFYEGSNIGVMFRSILALIQQQEQQLAEKDARIAELERERDAAVERLARYKKCIDCRRYPEIKKNLFCDDCVQGDKWQWCGEPLEVE